MQTAPKGSQRSFGKVVPTTGQPILHHQFTGTSKQPPQPLPTPTGASPYHLSLDQVLPAATMQNIQTAGRLVFHIVGDVGGVKAPQSQEIVAMHMIQDLSVPDSSARPVFFYCLGDVVYYYGQAGDYYSQFYEPYMHYDAPIFAIPGNHDGDIDPSNPSVPSLAAFVENFCATDPHLSSEAGDSGRDAMTQPNVYWTLETPFITFIGLYSNVPEGGWMDNNQIAWLQSELSSAPQDKALIVSMHHPIYSLDIYHSGSLYMRNILDQAIQASGRTPDAVFAGHVHNYQRFTRSFNEREVPYIVAGAGGYWNLHYIQKVNGAAIQTPYQIPGEDVTLESYCDNYHGYMLMEVDGQTLKGQYYSVPRPQGSWNAPAQLVDSFTLNLQTHTLQKQP
ncbi:MAG: metallophosphoesterase family protein [Ktedonobacteraceae bacterium]